MQLLAFLEYDPIVDLEIGPLSISPHGVGIAVGFLLGAILMLRRTREIGIDDEIVHTALMRAAIGAIVGARIAYVINHLGEFSNPLEWFEIWEGGISLLGGIAGGVLAGVPVFRSHGLSFWRMMDAAAPGLALGIFVGRIGDLVVADHLGKETDFFLGYVCPTAETASTCNAPIGEAVHQPALYDLMSVTLLLGLLLFLRRKPRYDGFLILVFGLWYGIGRIIEDFFRIDETHGTGLTGSQWTASVVALACLYALVVMRRTPWHSGRDVEDAPTEDVPSDSG